MVNLLRPSIHSLVIRTFSSLPSLRPTLLSRQSLFSPFLRTPTAFQPTSATAPLVAGAPTAQSATTTILDLVPATAISTHPAFAGLGGLGGQQVRFGPRNTMQRNSRLLQKRRHGFLARLRSKSGRKILQRRRAKGRKRMSA